jgi:hypothetical protein
MIDSDRRETNHMSNQRTALLLSGLAIVALVLAGCGKSSSGTSTTSTSQPARTASTASVTRPSTSSTPASSSSSHVPSGVSTITVAPATPTALVVSGTAAGVTATLHASTHTPTVGRPWPLHFTVTSGGALARAAVQYEYLFAGQVVARRSHYTFTGHFSDVFQWPATAVGYPLTFRAVILFHGATINLDYPVRVTG